MGMGGIPNARARKIRGARSKKENQKKRGNATFTINSQSPMSTIRCQIPDAGNPRIALEHIEFGDFDGQILKREYGVCCTWSEQ